MYNHHLICYPFRVSHERRAKQLFIALLESRRDEDYNNMPDGKPENRTEIASCGICHMLSINVYIKKKNFKKRISYDSQSCSHALYLLYIDGGAISVISMQSLYIISRISRHYFQDIYRRYFLDIQAPYPRYPDTISRLHIMIIMFVNFGVALVCLCIAPVYRAARYWSASRNVSRRGPGKQEQLDWTKHLPPHHSSRSPYRSKGFTRVNKSPIISINYNGISIPGSVGYISYPMFNEPTIAWVPSGFSWYIWL